MEIGESEEGKELLSKIPMKEIGLASMDDYLPLKSLGLERFYMSPINE
jgi:phosphonate transport system substrate-binding protein